MTAPLERINTSNVVQRYLNIDPFLVAILLPLSVTVQVERGNVLVMPVSTLHLVAVCVPRSARQGGKLFATAYILEFSIVVK